MEREGSGVEGRMEERAWMADWVLERESAGEDTMGVDSDVQAGLEGSEVRMVVVSEGLSSDIEREKSNWKT